MFYIIIGLRGSGKTTHATYIANKESKLGYRVFSNVDIQGTYKYDIADLGKKDISNCVLIFDEAGIDMSNRQYAVDKKSYVNSKEFRSFWKLSRHYGIKDIYVYSQAWDFDVTLRRLCDKMFIIRNSLLPNFSILKPVKPSWDTDDDGQPVIKWTIGGFPIPFYRRPYYKYFDSYSRDKLPSYDYPYIPYFVKYGKLGEKLVKFHYGIKHSIYSLHKKR